MREKEREREYRLWLGTLRLGYRNRVFQRGCLRFGLRPNWILAWHRINDAVGEKRRDNYRGGRFSLGPRKYLSEELSPTGETAIESI